MLKSALCALVLSVALPFTAHAAKDAAKAPAGYTDVVFETSAGNFTIRVNSTKAPVSAENFLKYVDDGFYNGTIFHRVINNFMVQGGGFTPDLKQKTPRGSIKNEAGNGLKNIMGTVAMARTNEINSASSQFFINVADNTFLDRKEARDGVGYAVFGRVTEGMDVVDKIKAVKTETKGGHQNVPSEDVVIKSIKRVSEDKK